MTLVILPSYNNIKVGTLEALYKVDLDQTYTLFKQFYFTFITNGHLLICNTIYLYSLLK